VPPSSLLRAYPSVFLYHCFPDDSPAVAMSHTNGTNGRQSIRNPNPPIEDSVFKSLRLDGRTVIITGGCGGIGYEVARGLAEAGANVCPPLIHPSVHGL
jgi:hypothetical protein